MADVLIRLHELFERHRARSIRRDEGSALISVLIVMLVLTIGALALASVVVNTSTVLGSARSTAQSRAAADAGVADVASRGQRGEDVCSAANYSSTKYTVAVVCDTSTVIITATGRGTGGGSTVTQAKYARVVSQKKLNGALVSASGTLNVSSLNITALAIDGDIVLNQGSFDCNNSMEIFGDLVVRNGSIQLSNQCRIHGDVIASGPVQIQNNAVGVDGNVYAMGGFTLTTAARIGGDVFARGNATINSGGIVTKSVTATGDVKIDGSTTTIGGNVWAGGAASVNATTVSGNFTSIGTVTVTSGAKVAGSVWSAGTVSIVDNATVAGTVTAAGAAASTVSRSTTGAVHVGGDLTQIENAARIKGDLLGGKAGQAVTIFPGVVIDGALKLRGTYTSWGTVTISGGYTPNASVAVPAAPSAPAVATPWALTTDAYEWIDLGFNATNWSGYTRIATPTCNFKDNTWPYSYNSGVAAVNALTSPTIIDARSCSSTDLYNAAFNIKTNVTFIVSAASAQRIKISSADGAAHTFNIITPDPVADRTPSCVAESGNPTLGKIDIGDANMDEKITGLAYSPCTVHVGQSSGGGRWNGQVYAGTVEWGGNSSPRMQLDYREVTVPGFVTPSAGGGGGGAGGASVLGALISLGDS